MCKKINTREESVDMDSAKKISDEMLVRLRAVAGWWRTPLDHV